MRLIVWNWNQATDAKVGHLVDMAPDVAVIPEGASDLEWSDDSSSTIFSGDLSSKGLLVVAFGDTTIEPAPVKAGAPWVLPVYVSGPREFLLLAIWTNSRKEGWPTNYATQVARAIDVYGEELASGEAVLAGDFNCSAKTASPGGHLVNVDRLSELGMVSAYHAANNVAHGDEREGTLYWMWSLEKPFHCDFAFVPERWQPDIASVEVGDASTWVGGRRSDHCPLVIDFAVR